MFCFYFRAQQQQLFEDLECRARAVSCRATRIGAGTRAPPGRETNGGRREGCRCRHPSGGRCRDGEGWFLRGASGVTRASRRARVWAPRRHLLHGAARAPPGIPGGGDISVESQGPGCSSLGASQTKPHLTSSCHAPGAPAQGGRGARQPTRAAGDRETWWCPSEPDHHSPGAPRPSAAPRPTVAALTGAPDPSLHAP